MNTTLKASPVVKVKSVKRATIASTIAKSSKNKTLKPILSFVASVIAGLGVFRNKKKAIKEIENNFNILQNDILNVQKTFENLFLREDLTEKEALEMLKRYKEIEKKRVLCSKEEYARAIFEEAKNNYGFANSKLFFKFSPNRDYRLCGQNLFINKNNEIIIWLNSIRAPEGFLNTIHHELRHLKQSQIGVNYNPEQYVKSLQESIMATKGEKITNKQEIFNRYTVKNVLSAFNQIEPDKNLIPSGYKDFAQKIVEHIIDTKYYEYGIKYKEDFLEADAFFAGESIAKLFGLK